MTWLRLTLSTRNRICWGLLFLLLAVHLFSVTRANIDLASDPAFLPVDEDLIFNGTRALVFPSSARDFFRELTVGSEQLYGRIFWNVCAITSALPAYLWGEPGIIVTCRMTQALLLLAGFLVLCFTWLRAMPVRLGALLVLLVLPSTTSFSTLPKPEPDQLFFLALYFYYLRRKKLQLGWHCIFLGLAFGAKISALPILLVCLIYSTAVTLRAKIPTRKIAQAGFSAMLGWWIAVPGISRVLIGEWGPLENYWRRTFLNTTHTLDDPSITPLSWLRFIVGTWLEVPSWWWLPLSLTAIATLGLAWKRMSRSPEENDFRGATLMMACGLVLNALIVFQTKRVWEHYLHLGAVLTTVSLASLAESLMRVGKNSFEKFAALAMLALLAGIMTPVRGARACAHYDQLAKRTQTPLHHQKLYEFEVLTTFLNRLVEINPGPLRASWDPFLYFPPSTKRLRVTKAWSMQSAWESGAEVIAQYRFRSNPTPIQNSLMPVSPQTAQSRSAHLSSGSNRCQKPPCYLQRQLLPTVDLFVRADLLLP